MCIHAGLTIDFEKRVGHCNKCSITLIGETYFEAVENRLQIMIEEKKKCLILRGEMEAIIVDLTVRLRQKAVRLGKEGVDLKELRGDTLT